MTLKINVSELVHAKDILIGAAKRLLVSVKNCFRDTAEYLHTAKNDFIKASGNKAPPVGNQKGGQN